MLIRRRAGQDCAHAAHIVNGSGVFLDLVGADGVAGRVAAHADVPTGSSSITGQDIALECRVQDVFVYQHAYKGAHNIVLADRHVFHQSHV